MLISARLGMAIAAGVPVLVLVSMGPVAALTGPASVLVWVGSALIGFLMALLFAELAGAHPSVNGGVAALAAAELRPRSRTLALVGQWSYWFGWSPALAINGLLVGAYLQRLLLPGFPSWYAALIATVVLAGSVAVNHFGMSVGGRLQAVLFSAVAVIIVALFAGALARGGIDADNLRPFAPPDGWASAGGWLAIAGGLFLAGWSAYGAELALAYATRYRRGVRDAVTVLVGVAIASVAAFAVVPFLLVATVGVPAVRQDPAAAFGVLSERAINGAAALVFAVLVPALLLGLNMIAIASSWTLHQMARTGEAWRVLGRLNRHGMPGNALRFDLAWNVGLLVVVTALSKGDVAGVPVALLAAANVGYFVSMCVALWASWHAHRDARPGGLFRLRQGLARLGPVLVVVNVVLLAAAGHAWGWRNVAVGAVALAGAILLAAWSTHHSAINKGGGRHDRTWAHSMGTGPAAPLGGTDRP